jgi:hypothetical protein
MGVSMAIGCERNSDGEFNETKEAANWGGDALTVVAVLILRLALLAAP